MKGKILIAVIMVALLIGGVLIGEVLSETQMTIHSQIAPPFFGEETIKVSSKELAKYLDSKPLKEKRGKLYLVVLSDQIFHFPELSTFQRFLERDNLNEYQTTEDPKVNERFQCDEFAFVLKGRAAENGFTLGIIWISYAGEQSDRKKKGHVGNLFITKENGKLEGFFVEPQTDQMIPASQPIRGKIVAVVF